MKTRECPPAPASLIESMRDVGYDLSSAIADLIDNSISAGATNIDIRLDTEEPVLAFIDDGCGMSDEELLSAMRHGSQSPRDIRGTDDLGRFGLGLKTASLSQCRQLTVVTRKNSATHAACWDSDFVEEHNSWMLQILSDQEISALPFYEQIPSQGTMVLWRQMDRLCADVPQKKLADHLYRRIDVARESIALVFHRFLLGKVRRKKVEIKINGDPVESFDPFVEESEACQRLPEEVMRVRGEKVRIVPFILPHHKKLSVTEWERSGGIGGHLKNQGFYVFRNNRLIIHGTWFGLARKSEITKLARVQIFIPSSMDEVWRVDIKKSSAQIPPEVEAHLRRIIDPILENAKRPHTSRGVRVFQENQLPLWTRRVSHDQFLYELNEDHPVISELIGALDGDRQKLLRSLLRNVGKALPMASLYSDLAQNTVADPIWEEHDIQLQVNEVVGRFLRDGKSQELVLNTLLASEPYKSFPRVCKEAVDFYYKTEGRK
jgi:hypothetical protein